MQWREARETVTGSAPAGGDPSEPAGLRGSMFLFLKIVTSKWKGGSLSGGACAAHGAGGWIGAFTQLRRLAPSGGSWQARLQAVLGPGSSVISGSESRAKDPGTNLPRTCSSCI